MSYINSFDQIYDQLVERIISTGTWNYGDDVRTRYEDGELAYTQSVEGVHFEITPYMGVPILRSKFVGCRWACTEMEWIWQEMSNNVSWLRDKGVTIWDEWEFPEDTDCSGYAGTIGKAYGYQLGHKRLVVEEPNGNTKGLNQVEYVLHELKYNPASRRIMTSLWGVDDLVDMALAPCVWSTHWSVHNGRLNLHVKQRSADVALGLPYNVLQYHALHALVADCVDLPLGTMYWNIDNAHIYDRHVDGLLKQVRSIFPLDVTESKPKLILPTGKDFFDRRLSGVKLEGYKHLGKYSYEVAI